MFGGLGPMELFIILLIVLVLFGAKRVPEIGQSLGKGIREFKKSMNDIGEQVTTPPPSTRAPDRLGGGDSPVRPMAQHDDSRPEPKRLI